MILKNIVDAANTSSTRLLFCLYWLMESERRDSDKYQIAASLLHTVESGADFSEEETLVSGQFAPVSLCYFCCDLGYNSFHELCTDLQQHAVIVA